MPDDAAWDAALSKMTGSKGIPSSVSVPKKRLLTPSAPDSGARDDEEASEARGGKKKKFKGGGGKMKGGKRQSSTF